MDKNLGSKQIFLNLSIYQNLYEKGTKQMKKNSSLRRSSSKKNKKIPKNTTSQKMAVLGKILDFFVNKA